MAKDNTTYNRINSISRSRLRKQALICEDRNIICAYMKRNDPVTRRFIQYMVMHPGEALILARDAKTERIVTAPDEEELWVRRWRPGVSDRDDWVDEVVIDPDFFDELDEERKWHFGFDSYYEVYIWQFKPGGSAAELLTLIRDVSSSTTTIFAMNLTVTTDAPPRPPNARAQGQMDAPQIRPRDHHA
jgi:hypothetical protein